MAEELLYAAFAAATNRVFLLRALRESAARFPRCNFLCIESIMRLPWPFRAEKKSLGAAMNQGAARNYFIIWKQGAARNYFTIRKQGAARNYFTN